MSTNDDQPTKPEDVTDGSGIIDPAVDVVADLGEFALDNFLTDGPVKELPVVGGVAKLVRGALGVRDWIFVKKLAAFLSNDPGLSEEVRNKFRRKLDEDRDFRVRTATHLTVTLDRLDDLEKAHLLARLFREFVSGRINQGQLRRFSSALDRALVADLLALRDFVRKETPLSRTAYDGLEAAGLAIAYHSIVRATSNDERTCKVDGINVLVTATAVRLVEVVF